MYPVTSRQGFRGRRACEWAPGACTAALVYLKCAIHFMLGSEYLSIYFVFLKKLCI